MTTSPERTVQDNIEVLDHGVILEWIEARQIMVYRPPDASQQAAEALFDRAEALVREWPAGKPHLVMIDFQSAGIIPSVYMRERGKVMWSLRSDVLVATAMLMVRTPVGRFLTAVTGKTQGPQALMSVHFSRDEAIVWLKKVGNIS